MAFECQVNTEVSKNLVESQENPIGQVAEYNQFHPRESFCIPEVVCDLYSEKERCISKPKQVFTSKKANPNSCSLKQLLLTDRSITDLPPALISEILKCLDRKELGIVSCASTYLCRLASEHHVRKEFYCERWGLSTAPARLASGLSDDKSWKEFFVEREFRSKTFMGRYSMGILYGHTEPVRTVFLLVSAKLIFTSGYNQTVKIWIMEEGLLIASSRSLGCTMRAVAADTKLLVAGGTDGFIHCWKAVEGCPHLFDIRGPQDQNIEFRLWEHQGPITSLALDFMRIYSGSWDMTVRVWDGLSL